MDVARVTSNHEVLDLFDCGDGGLCAETAGRLSESLETFVGVYNYVDPVLPGVADYYGSDIGDFHI